MNLNSVTEEFAETPEKIVTFSGSNSFLSNFHPASFVWKGIFWSTSEHAYQAAKSLDKNVWLKFSKMPTAGKAKREGKKVEMRPDWNQVKVDIMYEIVREKFRQNPDLRQALIDTGDAILEEGNTWKDAFWGIYPPNSGNGRNELGKILMRLREEFK